MRPSLVTLFAAVLVGPACMAQWNLHFDGSIPVHRQGTHLDLAWAGGLNFVQVSEIDLDGDGLKDLFLFDRSGNKVITLLNTGGTGTPGYALTRRYDRVDPFPKLHDWALLRDYDRDGREDLFTYSTAGFAVYRNTSTPGNLSFELITPQMRSNYVSNQGDDVFANLFMSQIDLPGIVDVDGDGDLDILTFSLLNTYVEYHRNLSMERYGTPDSLVFELRNRCWGFFLEDANTNAIRLDRPCSFNVPNPEVGDGPHGDPSADGRPKAHAGSALTPLDLNGDGLMDLLLGDVGFNNVVALYNGGTTGRALMTQVDDSFPSYDRPVDLALFPASFYLDLDNDGRRDLLVSPNALSLARNVKSMWRYKNTGTDASPVFEFQQEDLFQDRMLDFGEGAYPVPFDHDGDGLMDLVVANHHYFEPRGNFGAMALLRNTGTATEPAFELVTDDWMGLSISGIGFSMYPAFADLDGDGDLDMLIGDMEGRLHHYENIATGPVANFRLTRLNITDALGAIIDVGQFATPHFTDLDGDGLVDLVVGERNGNLNQYRNTGTAQVPAWTLVTENLGGVSTAEWWNVTGHSVPFFFRNAGGDREVLLGSASGWLYHYGGIEGNINGTWTLLDSAFMGLYDGHRTAPCLYDFTGDGKLDLVLGNYRGGLSFWRSDAPSGITGPRTPAQPGFTLLPNPAAERVELVLDEPPPAGSYWSLRNGLGQEVLRRPAATQRSTVELGGLSEGVYLVRLEGTLTSGVRRLVVVR